MQTIKALEAISGEAMVLATIGLHEYVVLESTCRTRLSKSQWQDAVVKGSTEMSFCDWREDQITKLKQASSVFVNGMKA